MSILSEPLSLSEPAIRINGATKPTRMTRITNVTLVRSGSPMTLQPSLTLSAQLSMG